MPIEVLLNMTGKIFLMVLLGYFLKKKGIITDELQKGLATLLNTSILPLSILSAANVTLSSELAHGLAKLSAISISYYILSILSMTFLSRRLKTDDASQKIFITMSVFANNAFIGFPLISEIFGEENVLYAVVFNTFYHLFMFTYGITILNRKAKFSIKSLIRNPVTVISFVSVAIFFSPFRFPVFIQSAMETVGSMTVPLSMIIIGCSMSAMKASQIFKDKYSYLVSALRLIIFPLIMFAVMKLIGVSTPVSSICVVMAALPCGSLNVILAEQYDCNPTYAARTVVQSMMLMPFFLPIMIYLTNFL